MLPVFGQSGYDVQFRMWFLDTGDSDCEDIKGYACILPDQLAWFRSENKKITDTSKGRGFLFIHIPLDEYRELYNDGFYVGIRDEWVCCQALNTGVYSTLLEQKTVEWVSCGHDHNNDYYGEYSKSGINLAYGRKTGFGSYGPDK